MAKVLNFKQFLIENGIDPQDWVDASKSRIGFNLNLDNILRNKPSARWCRGGHLILVGMQMIISNL